MNGRLIDTELGRERLCSACGEYWPDDAEFFFLTRGKPTGNCKACFYEKHEASRQAAQIATRAKRAAQAQVAAA